MPSSTRAGLRFSFRAVPFAATLVLVILGIALGNWQTRRAFDKTALQARLNQRAAAPPLVLDGALQDPAAVEFRRVRVRGRFVAGWPLFLDNRPLNGRSGTILLMPFTIAGSNRQVLVARGWLPRAPGASAPGARPAPPAPPGGTVTIEGIAVTHAARVLQLGTAPRPAPGAVLQNLDIVEVARASDLDLQPFLVEQTGAEEGADDSGLVRKWPTPVLDVDRHKGYAFQWYALAAMALVFFLVTGMRRGSRQAG